MMEKGITYTCECVCGGGGGGERREEAGRVPQQKLSCFIFSPNIDKLCGVRHRPRFVRIDAALGGQKYGICPPRTASMRTNRGRRLTPHNSSIQVY